MNYVYLSNQLKKYFFNSKFSTLITLTLGILGFYFLFCFLDWAFFRATWTNDLRLCQRNTGACWGFVTEKWRLILFGRYPYEEHWRAAISMFVLSIGLAPLIFYKKWVISKPCSYFFFFTFTIVVFFVLLKGGFFNLTMVDSELWGGLPLSIILTILGMGLSIPLGLLLALMRHSKNKYSVYLASIYIETIRGVPLITVLFLAVFVFPLLLSESSHFNAFWRVLCAIILFQSAYTAETIRGGLQTIKNSQYDAAKSLGLNCCQQYLYIILPQVFIVIVPALVNSLLSTFLDTSLVMVVSMYDLTGSLRLALGDANWREFFIEGYLFIAIIYFSLSFALSRYSIKIENQLKKLKF